MKGYFRSMLLLLMVTATCGQTFPYCSPTTASPSNNQGPKMPSLPETFQTEIEANFVGAMDSYTIDIQEYFDNEGNQGAMYMAEDGINIFAIYSYETSEFLTGTTGLDCTVFNLTDPSNNILLGDANIDGKPHIFTSNAALRFGKGFGETYIGQDRIRGIAVDHWKACVFWKSYNAYFTVDYYFTMSNWTAAEGVNQVPVRAWVQGTAQDNSGKITSYNHYYDFFSFQQNISDYSVFETPSGVICNGRIVTKEVPELAGQYYYRQEIISPSNSLIQNADVWFDSVYKLVRYDHRTLHPQAPYFDTNPFTEIHDYNTGVAYIIDNVLGNCTVATIENGAFDVNLNFTSAGNNGQFYDSVKTSLGLFYLDDTYSYEGQRTIDGKLCDVFISKRTDFVPLGFNGVLNSTFEYYFLSSEWTEVANPGVSVDTTIPVRAVITILDIDFQVIHNFYNFDEEHPNLDNFDVSRCFDDDQTIDFQLSFLGRFYPTVAKYQNFFELSVRTKISELISISPLRIQKSAIKHDNYHVFYLATLLEEPPASARFHKFQQQVLENKNDKLIASEGNPDNCAYYCLTEETFSCQSFDVCTTKNICYLSKSTADDGTLVSNSDCDHYTRNVKQNTFLEQTVDDAYAALKDVVYRDLFAFDIPLGNDQTKTYRASSVRQNIIRADQSSATELSGADYMKQFIATRNRRISGHSDNYISQVSVDDCATACVLQELFECEAFTYNVINGDCRLSKIHPSDHKDVIQPAQNIDLYERNYVYKFKKTPGTVMLFHSNVIYQAIPDPNLCAKLCTGLQEFTCRSFEYCEDIQGCILGQSHQLDIPETTFKSEPACDHYSRNYIDDFKFLKGKVIALANSQIVEGVALAECAKICTDQGADCLGFDYCGNDTLCRTTPDSVKNIGSVTVESSAYCDHYSRQYYPDGSKITAYSVRNAPDKNLKFTTGALVGMGVGMLIAGILLALGISFCLRKTGVSTDWNPATKLQNME